jgi:hypothetical protein
MLKNEMMRCGKARCLRLGAPSCDYCIYKLPKHGGGNPVQSRQKNMPATKER